MSVLILVLVGTLYYQSVKTQMLSSHRLAMQLESESYVPKLKKWLENGHIIQNFPKDLAYKTALYGYDKDFLAGSIRHTPLNFSESIILENDVIHLILPLSPYGLGEYYLVFETPDDKLWKTQILRNYLLYGSLLLILFALVGFTLSRLFLRPMNEAITLLDDFIKDTTHELNTPVSAILTNVEALGESEMGERERKKLKRLEIASKTISTLYDDLTYLIFNHNLARQDIKLDLGELIHERLEYFNDRIEQKKLTLSHSIEPKIYWVIDRTKATRLIDNLLSNAIKYNKMGGSIFVSLSPGHLCIEDTGIGIPEEMIERVFERYMRADKSVGGFGIGLNIVAMIAKEYGLHVSIESKEHQGTKLCVRWNPL